MRVVFEIPKATGTIGAGSRRGAVPPPTTSSARQWAWAAAERRSQARWWWVKYGKTPECGNLDTQLELRRELREDAVTKPTFTANWKKSMGRGRLRLLHDLAGDKVPDVAALIRQNPLATGEASCYWPLLVQTKEGP